MTAPFVPLRGAAASWAPLHRPPAPAPVAEPEPDRTGELEARLAAVEVRAAAAEARAASATAALADSEARRAEAEDRLAREGARIAAAIADIDAARAEVAAEMRAGTAEVVLAAARRIAGDALHADPRLLDALVEEASRALGGRVTRVRVSPQDAELLRARLSGVEVAADPAIEAGCACEGPAGGHDATIESAMAAISAVVDQWRSA